MECRNCQSISLIRKGKRREKQRYKCAECGKYSQDSYTYKLYDFKDDDQIKTLNAEGVGINSMSQILGYSKNSIMRRILYLGSQVIYPVYCEYNQVYEVDELCTYVGKKKPSHRSWITYAINRKSHQIISVSFGGRTKENLGKVIEAVKSYNPKKIITDKLNSYPKLIEPYTHDTTRYSNNHIERGNLNLRTHVKRLFRKTICYSRSQKMLEATILLYFDYHNWRIKMSY